MKLADFVEVVKPDADRSEYVTAKYARGAWTVVVRAMIGGALVDIEVSESLGRGVRRIQDW